MSWTFQNLIFLGFDNHDMFRKRGFAMKGKHIVCRAEFTMDGIEGVYSTEGT